ncbi:MAG: TetR/AcrR family transcriptional regulator [Chloroflexi bacterium]|nr:TetR/AcrR family transcriptional regulator [Chloroflexota bacterium]
MVDRREQRRLDTRRRLLDAAEQVFSQKGYEEASVLDITETADVSKRTFYLHFTDKEAVIEALALRGFQELRAQIETKDKAMHAAAPSGETFRQHFQSHAEVIFAYAASQPEMMQIVFGLQGSFRLQTLTREFMVRAWEENFQHKCVFFPHAPVPWQVTANAIAGVTHQLLCWWFQNPNDFSPADMAAMSTSLLFDGIAVNFDQSVFVDVKPEELVTEK